MAVGLWSPSELAVPVSVALATAEALIHRWDPTPSPLMKRCPSTAIASSSPMAHRKPRTTSRNTDLIRGIGKYSRSKMYHKRGLWAIKAKNGGAFPRHDAAPAPAKTEEKSPKFYPADDVKILIANRRKVKPTKLRASITPGMVLILLAGRFMGKRIVFLKQLTS